MILTWLLANWRLLAYAATAVAALWLALLVRHWHEDSLELPKVQAALETERSCGEGSQCAKRAAELTTAAQAASRVIQDTYDAEIARVRSERPVRVVRLCAPANHLSGAQPARPADGAGPAPDVVHGTVRENPDIGPALYALARDADEVSARLRALQQWNAALATPPK